YLNETLYLHKIIAETFLGEPETEEHRYVMFKNGNKLDCRLENIGWATRSEITRNTKKHHSKSGFRGVYKEGDRFRATLYNKSERIDLGFFETAEEAAVAYNKKSEEIFGRTRSLNKVKIENEKTSDSSIELPFGARR
ncbi:MAG TPA: HNH endonuclease, partial [Catalimonadaceae bacterium]|nr:HNH endonuclease [Catalimonadaceae bacterium]